MRTTQQFSITLPNEMADIVKTKVAAGEYATESEVIRDGLRVLMARDRAMDSWLHYAVGPAYDALKANPARAVTIDQVRATLAAEHEYMPESNSDDQQDVLVRTHKRRVVTKGRYQDFFHHRLWCISEQSAKAAIAAPERKADWENDAITALLFGFHTVEAYCNYVIQVLDPEITKAEDKGKFMAVGEKIAHVMKLLELSMPKDDPPLSTVFELKTFRNLIAHGRSEYRITEAEHDSEEYAPYPTPAWRRKLIPRDEFVKKLPDVEKFLQAVHDRYLIRVQERIEGGTLPNHIWQNPEPLRGVSSVHVRSTAPLKGVSGVSGQGVSG